MKISLRFLLAILSLFLLLLLLFLYQILREHTLVQSHEINLTLNMSFGSVCKMVE